MQNEGPGERIGAAARRGAKVSAGCVSCDVGGNVTDPAGRAVVVYFAEKQFGKLMRRHGRCERTQLAARRARNSQVYQR